MSSQELRQAAETLRDPIRCNTPVYEAVLADWLEAVSITWVWDEHPDDVETPDGWPLTLDDSTDTFPLKIARLINGGAA